MLVVLKLQFLLSKVPASVLTLRAQELSAGRDTTFLSHAASGSVCLIPLCSVSFLSALELRNAVESQTRSRWTSLYFTPVCSVLLFNVGDLLGRSMATWLKWPGRKAKERYALLVVTILRIGMCTRHDAPYF